ncbi:hypothetical protein ACS0TY_009824 [Phlomoides rotata]
MERLDSDEFPGFQRVGPREGCIATGKPPLSRLQRRAPCPLLLKTTSSDETSGTSKDPIPLLSPLVLPSMLHHKIPNSH